MRSALAILLVVFAGIAVYLWQVDEPPVTAAGERETQPIDAQPANGAAPAVSDPADEESGATDRSSVEQGGVFGVVLDHVDAPLGNVLVRLIPDNGNEREALVQPTRTDGTFGFANVEGKFLVHTYNSLAFSQKVEVARGERVDVVLQADEPCVLLYGTLTRGGEPIVDRSVFLTGHDRLGEVAHESPTNKDGYYHHLVRPGSYGLSVAGPPTTVGWMTKGVTIWAENSTMPIQMDGVALTAATQRVRRDLQLPEGNIEVHLTSTLDGKPIHEAFVTCSRPTGYPTCMLRTDENGRVCFRDLDVGDWVVIATHSLHQPTQPRTIGIRAGDSRRPLDLKMTAAGGLLVKLHHRGDLYEPFGLESLELQVAGAEPITGSRAEGAMWIYEGTRFQPVAVGTHQLLSRDQRQPNGEMRYSAFEPFGSRPVVVEAGKTNTVSIDVQRRPLLEVPFGDGNENAQITVRSPTETVHSYVGRLAGWHAPVPPGDYTVIVEHGADRYEQRVTIINDDVVHVVTPR